MKINFVSSIPKDVVQLRFTEGGLNKFVEKNGVNELHIGYGKAGEMSQRKSILFLRKIVATAKQQKIKEFSLVWSDLRPLITKDMSDAKLGETLGVSFLMANFEFVTYKTKPEGGFGEVEEVSIVGAPKKVAEGLRRGEMIATEVNMTRELSNTPGGDMTPKHLAAAAKAAVKGTEATVEVLGQKQMEKLGMGAVLGIAQGSAEEPQFIVVEYWGAAKTKKPIVLVGKGVTFDTGGLNIKPGDSMLEMNMDMSGGAAVIHTVALAAKLKVAANVVAIVPAVENMPSGTSLRPGDIVKSFSGKTIEVLNTDAEGRVILADGLSYAKKYEPKAVIDVATLTGAALVALGQQASAIMSNDEALQKTLIDLGEESGEYMWPFPLWEEYEDMIKGNFGDIPNISTAGNSRYGGVIAGGMFLKAFADELKCPWAHIDMAPRMTAVSTEFLSKGALGTPVRLLLAFIEKHADTR